MDDSLKAALAGRYRVERELGRGGMATVDLARDLKHDRLVAVKVLRPELAALLGTERFLREIGLTAQLQHPHILTLIDSGEADGFVYYVMPYVEGGSLRQRLEKEGPLPLDEALRITRAIASALDFAHGRGAIHRDIKPENIMLHQGEPMVADFGIALAVSTAGRERLTETGLSLGTPAYMSPEQATADPKLDGRTDQYSLASVLYEMLAGEPPYTGPTAQAIIAKRLSEPIPHLSTLRLVPSAVELATSRALSKSPADRFHTMGEFASALALADRRPVRRTPLTWGVGALAVLIIIGGGAWLYSHRNSRLAGDPNVVPFTSSPGQKFDPAFSRDGNEIAYSWNGENHDNGDIYVKLIGAGGPLRITSNPAEEHCPAWSPDGRYIAFMRDDPSGSRSAYFVIPALGGSERKIGEAYGQRALGERGVGRCIDWSLDGKYLIVADQMYPVATKDIGTGSFVIGTMKVRPRVPSADGKPISFKRNQKMNFWMQVYNLSVDEKTHKPSATFEYDVVHTATNKAVVHTTESTEQMGNVGDQVTLQKSLSASNLEPGSYRIEIKVNDNISKQTVDPTATFTVE